MRTLCARMTSFDVHGYRKRRENEARETRFVTPWSIKSFSQPDDKDPNGPAPSISRRARPVLEWGDDEAWIRSTKRDRDTWLKENPY